MEFLSQHVIPPTGHYLDLLRVLAVMTYLIHLPYIGITLGATGLSMWLTFSDSENPHAGFQRFAGQLIDTFLGNTTAMFVLGVFPLLVLPLIYGQWFAGMKATPIKYFPMIIPAVIVAFFFLRMYRRTYASRKTNMRKHVMAGLTGVGILKLSYFVLIASEARLHDPEKWFRIKNLLIMLLNWNVIWKFTFFIHLAVAMTGVAILFFFFVMKKEETLSDPVYATLVRKFGAGLALAFTFALPVFYLFYIFTTPDVAFDNRVYVMAACVVAAAMLGAFHLLAILRSDEPRYGVRLMGIYLAIFTLTSAVDARTMNVASGEHVHLLAAKTEAARAARHAELEGLLEGSHGADVGKQVYTTVCMQCHSFDEKLVGPALRTVLAKYKDDVEALKAFVNNPTKQNPDFPPMPNPGLLPSQVGAVAEYVLEQLDSGGSGQ